MADISRAAIHDDVIKWKHVPRNWPFVGGIHRSPVNSPHKGQWRGALTFSLICVWINAWVSNREAGDSRRYRAPNDVIVMSKCVSLNENIRIVILTLLNFVFKCRLNNKTAFVQVLFFSWDRHYHFARWSLLSVLQQTLAQCCCNTVARSPNATHESTGRPKVLP